MAVTFKIRSVSERSGFYSATVECYDVETGKVLGDALTIDVDKHFKTRVLNAFKDKIATRKKINQVKEVAQATLDSIAEDDLDKHTVTEIRSKTYEPILD